MQTATVMAAVFGVVGWAGPVLLALRGMVLMVCVDAGVRNKSPDKGSVVYTNIIYLETLLQ